MELFSLLAKLTLDADDFNRSIDDAQKRADNFEAPEDESLGLDTSEFDDNLETSQALGQGFETTMTGVFGGIKNALITTGIVGLIAGIVNGLKQAVDMTAETADGIDKGAAQLGISREAYQKWDYALQQSGASISDVKKGLMNMRLALMATQTPFADAEDSVDGLADKAVGLSADAYEAIRDLGLMDKLTAKEFGSAEELMDAALKSLASFDGSKEERGVLVTKLFGRGGDVLNDMLDEGYDGVQALLKQADSLGLVMSDDEIDNAVAYGDAVADLQAELKAIQSAFVADIIPNLTSAVKEVTKIIAFFNPRNKKESMSKMFADDDEEFSEELATIEGTAAAAESLADKLFSMGSTSQMTAEQYEIWKGTAEELIKLVPELGTKIDIETGQINANSDEIKENIKQWERLAKQKALQKLKEDKYNEILERNKEVVDQYIEANKKAAEAEKKKVEAQHKFSNQMKEYGLGELDFSGDVDQQISDLMSELAEGGDQNEDILLGLGLTLKDYGVAMTDAAKAQAEADRLAEDLKKGEEEYQEWLKTAESLYGLVDEEAVDSTKDVKKLGEAIENLPNSKDVRINILPGGRTALPKAIGDAYVPYDNYPALLHRGERVLTATQARRGEGSNLDLGALEEKVAAAVRSGMQGVTVNSYLNGRAVTEEVNRETIRNVKARRFR